VGTGQHKRVGTVRAQWGNAATGEPSGARGSRQSVPQPRALRWLQAARRAQGDRSERRSASTTHNAQFQRTTHVDPIRFVAGATVPCSRWTDARVLFWRRPSSSATCTVRRRRLPATGHAKLVCRGGCMHAVAVAVRESSVTLKGYSKVLVECGIGRACRRGVWCVVFVWLETAGILRWPLADTR
jgi:hypothetical protein